MPFGNGRIIDSVASGSAMNSLNNLTSIISTMGSFNNTQLKADLGGNLTTFMNTVGTWCRGEVTDLDSTNYAILQNIANPFSADWVTCNAPFTTDSWVPSNNQNASYNPIACQVSNGNVGDTTTCTATLTNGVGTCGGCMDTTKLSTMITTGNILTQLNTRYGATCTFNAKMNNIWANFYDLRNTALGPTASAGVGSGVLRRASDVEAEIISTSAGGVFFTIDALSAKFISINTAMTAISTLTDPTTGLVAGLNCALFGEDFIRLKDVLCSSMYTNMYTMRLALGISCYGVLFAMCCIVCTGVRHYKHNERKGKVQDAFFKKGDDYSGAALRMKE